MHPDGSMHQTTFPDDQATVHSDVAGYFSLHQESALKPEITGELRARSDPVDHMHRDGIDGQCVLR